MYSSIGKKWSVVALAVAAAIASGAVAAHGGGSGMGGGQGMMGSGQSGQGMMGQGTGQGMMGPGMMGPGMMGPGMMGPGMMGPGMMGQGMMGQGMMGQGMMGQGMMGQGMMGPYMSGVLGLSDDQREQLEEIQRENAGEHWQMMQEMQQHRRNMVEVYGQDAPDPGEVGDAFSRMMETRREMIEQQVRMQNRMREVLTDEQRQRLQEMQRFHWSDQ